MDVKVDLPPVLRARFDAVWALVPPDVRARIGPTLTVTSFARVRNLWCPCGRIRVASWVGAGCCAGVPGARHPPLIWLRERLARPPAVRVVAIVLHELAHAADPLVGGWRLHAADEVAACDLAVAWATGTDTPLARAVAVDPNARGYRDQHAAWCFAAPAWWSDDDRREDALLREVYAGDGAD